MHHHDKDAMITNTFNTYNDEQQNTHLKHINSVIMFLYLVFVWGRNKTFYQLIVYKQLEPSDKNSVVESIFFSAVKQRRKILNMYY